MSIFCTFILRSKHHAIIKFEKHKHNTPILYVIPLRFHNLDIIPQIQIENKAYYLKTKILFMKTKHIVIFELSRCEQKNLKKFGNCRARSETETAIFCRQIPSSEQVSHANYFVYETQYLYVLEDHVSLNIADVKIKSVYKSLVTLLF